MTIYTPTPAIPTEDAARAIQDAFRSLPDVGRPRTISLLAMRQLASLTGSTAALELHDAAEEYQEAGQRYQAALDAARAALIDCGVER